MKVLKKIQYNSPVILTFALLSLIVLVISYITNGVSDRMLFMVFRSSPADPLTYLRMVGHVLGHANVNHYFGNFLLILLIGPMLEEKYGSATMLIMILITALVTGFVFKIASMGTLMGASGVAFMLILLSSFVNLRRGRIPLTFILVVVVYIGQEVFRSFTTASNVSYFTHIIGGLCGAILGFYINKKRMEKVASDNPELEI
jgi:membrane associated rhomboid family serine protease